jgi:hypothetical protein
MGRLDVTGIRLCVQGVCLQQKTSLDGTSRVSPTWRHVLKASVFNADIWMGRLSVCHHAAHVRWRLSLTLTSLDGTSRGVTDMENICCSG